MMLCCAGACFAVLWSGCMFWLCVNILQLSQPAKMLPSVHLGFGCLSFGEPLPLYYCFTAKSAVHFRTLHLWFPIRKELPLYRSDSAALSTCSFLLSLDFQHLLSSSHTYIHTSSFSSYS